MDARIYKTVDGRELRVHIFYPGGYSADSGKRYPAAVSFHGGAWIEGPIEWGEGDAKFMRSLGFVGIAVEYRLADNKTVSALDCIWDANSSIRWLRIHADELNIDPQRILAIGHSAGGHLSLCTAMFPGLMQEDEDSGISSVPDAVVALAPAVSLCNDKWFRNLLIGRTGAEKCSPSDNVRKLEIPVLIIQGTADECLPIRNTREFVAKMKDAENDIELIEVPNGKHGLFYDDKESIRLWHEAVAKFVSDF